MLVQVGGRKAELDVLGDEDLVGRVVFGSYGEALHLREPGGLDLGDDADDGRGNLLLRGLRRGSTVAPGENEGDGGDEWWFETHLPPKIVPVPAYRPSAEELRALVDEQLRAFLDSTQAGLDKSGPLVSEIGDLIAAGGKRIRPAFCYWGYRAAEGRHAESILKAAASLELLHSFALIHDDIMDASTTRRGRPTVHSKLGVATALLVGDLALVLADDLFMTSGFMPDVLLRAFAHYSRMRQEVIVGQFMDLEVGGRDDITEDDARLIARMKSGRYSIREPLLIGSALGGAPTEDEELVEFGELAGEAFQLRDDLLGSFGDSEELGKPVDADIREGKRNILFAKTAARLRGPERDYFMSRWGSGEDLSEDEVDRLRSLIEVSGARAETEKGIADLVARAKKALNAAGIENEARGALDDLIHETTYRRV